MRARPDLRPQIVRLWYQLVSALDTRAIMLCMNYGYASFEQSSLPLAPADEPHRYNLQLYHAVVAPVNLHNCNVLEVGSGRGGGAAYLARMFAPRSYTGVDFASRAARFCGSFHRAPGLAFLAGDAERLPFAGCAFDAVVNVESSHTYWHIEQFFSEVRRVLRPGGHFCFADWRATGEVALLRAQLQAAGLEMLEDENITPQVVQALSLDNERKAALIEQHAPAFIRARFGQFAGLRGTSTYQNFNNGSWQYRRFLLRTQQ